MPNKPLHIRPAPGKIVVEALIQDSRIDLGNGVKLWVPPVSDKECIIAKVIANHGANFYDAEADREVSPAYEEGTLVVIGKFTGSRFSMSFGRERKEYIILSESSVMAEIVEDQEDDQQQELHGRPEGAAAG